MSNSILPNGGYRPVDPAPGPLERPAAAQARQSMLETAAPQAGLELLPDMVPQRSAGLDAELAENWIVLLDELIQRRRSRPAAV